MKKRLLTWKPNWRDNGGRWCKQIDGKVNYFGYAKSKTDTKSYKFAEQKYLRFMEDLEANRTVEIPVNQATITDVTERFLQNSYSRYERGDISASHFDKLRWCLDHFLDSIGHGKKACCVGELDLEQYKNHCLSLPISSQTNRQISTETAKGMLTVVKTMYRWAWKMRLIESLPRNIDDLTKAPNGNGNQPKIKTFTLDEVKTLWKNAISRTKCFMALALNCGMGQRDISDLRVNEVDWKNGYIERARSKTGVIAKYKLWDITLELLKEHRQEGSQGNDRVILTQKTNFDEPQKQLLRMSINDDGKLTKSDAIKNAFWRLQRKTRINGGRSFYSLRKTGATLIEQIDPLVTEMYLSHSERGMKRNYAQRDWGRLEKALKKMEKKLKL